MSENSNLAPVNHAAPPDQVETVEEGAMTKWSRANALIKTGLRVDVEEDKILLSRALVPADKELQHMRGETFEAVNWVAHPASRVDPTTGEITTVIRCVFITPDGLTLTGSGDAVQKFVAWVRDAYPKPPWTPPLRIQVIHPISRVGANVGKNYVALKLEPRKPNGAAPKTK